MLKETLPGPSEELPFFYGQPPRPDALADHFSHFVIAVADLDRSEAWYRDVIGLDPVGRNLTAEKRPHALLRANTGQMLILVQHENVELARQSSHGVHHGFVLTQNQFRRAMARLAELGYSTSAQREEFIARGQYSVDIYDPDGNHYQIETTDDKQAHELLLPGTGVVDCGPAGEYAVGEVKLFREGNFYLVRMEEGFLALSRWCTHMNGLLTYQRAHWRFWCPMHEATYNRRGEPTCSTNRHPDLKPLRLNPVEIGPDGHVRVDTGVVNERQSYEVCQAAPAPMSEAAAGAVR